MAPRRRLATMAVLAVLAVSACSQNDAKRSDVVDAMVDADIPEQDANCIGDGFEDAFNQDELNDLAGATSEDDIPEGSRDEVDQILDECLGTGPSSSGDDASDEGDDTSDTTAGDDSSSGSDSSDTSDTTAG